MFKTCSSNDIPCELCSFTQQIDKSENSAENGNDNFLRDFDKYQHIYHAGAKCEYLYAVHSGCCKEYSVDVDGKEYIHNFYFPGDILGLEAMSSKSYAYAATALMPLKVCAIPVAKLMHALNHTQGISMRLMNIFCNKLKHDSSIRLTSSAKQRVAGFLLNMSERLANNKTHEFTLPIAQQDISNKVGIAFETLSRILQTMQKEQIIHMQMREVKIKNINKLREIYGS